MIKLLLINFCRNGFELLKCLDKSRSLRFHILLKSRYLTSLGSRCTATVHPVGNNNSPNERNVNQTSRKFASLFTVSCRKETDFCASLCFRLNSSFCCNFLGGCFCFSHFFPHLLGVFGFRNKEYFREAVPSVALRHTRRISRKESVRECIPPGKSCQAIPSNNRMYNRIHAQCSGTELHNHRIPSGQSSQND